MTFLSTPPRGRGVSRWGLGGVLLAVTATFLHTLSLDDPTQALLLAKSLARAGLADDPFVAAAHGAAYVWGSWLAAHFIVGLGGILRVSLETAAWTLQMLLWVLQAACMYRLAKAASRSREAAFIATGLFGACLSFVNAEAPYSVTGIDRALGLIPLLWALTALIREERWKAFTGLMISTFLHANPALHFWGIFLIEDAWAAWRSRENRAAFGARLLSTGAFGLILYRGATSGAVSPDFARAAQWVLSSSIGGADIALSDRLLALEGAAMIALAVWQAGRFAARPVFARAAAVSLATAAAGSWAYFHCGPGSGLCFTFMKTLPWVSLYTFELLGQIAYGIWLARLIQRRNILWPVLLLSLAMSWHRDLVIRGTGLAVAACISLRAESLGGLLAAGAGCLPFVYRFSRETFQAAAERAGGRGGIFHLPGFSMGWGFALFGALSAGIFLNRRKLLPRSASYCLLAASLAALGIQMSGLRISKPLSPDILAVADWMRQNTEPQARVLALPPPDHCASFLIKSERSISPCFGYLPAGILYGGRAADMAERLESAGFDFGSLGMASGVSPALQKTRQELTPQIVSRYAQKYGTQYLLLAGPPPWQGEPLYRSGNWALYRIKEPF